MKRKNLLFAISLISACLASCRSAKGNEKKNVTFGDMPHATGTVSIGLGETKLMPFSTIVSSEIKQKETNLLKKEAHLSLEASSDADSYFTYELLYNNDLITDKFQDSLLSAIKITCSKEFEEEFRITKASIETATSIYTFDFEITLVFNDEYVNYPPFAPSYTEGCFKQNLMNWNRQAVFYNYLALNFEWFYNLKTASIRINDISFSDNLIEYIDGVSFLSIDKNISWNVDIYEMIMRNSFESEGYSFEEIRSVDYTSECGEQKGLIYKIEFKKKRDYMKYTSICGDVNYDVTINGMNYIIRDMYYF
ncbi:MAG: hypothetical protein MJ228_00455 [Bacilli bacterium]|nr:hypothetical protein [Bacilli bacterium]